MKLHPLKLVASDEFSLAFEAPSVSIAANIPHASKISIRLSYKEPHSNWDDEDSVKTKEHPLLEQKSIIVVDNLNPTSTYEFRYSILYFETKDSNEVQISTETSETYAYDTKVPGCTDDSTCKVCTIA